MFGNFYNKTSPFITKYNKQKIHKTNKQKQKAKALPHCHLILLLKQSSLWLFSGYKSKLSLSFWRSVELCNHFSNSCTMFCIRAWAGSNQGEPKWCEIGLTPAEWTIASAEQSWLIEEKGERLVKQQERRHHKPKMLIPKELPYAWLHRKWEEGKDMQGSIHGTLKMKEREQK